MRVLAAVAAIPLVAGCGSTNSDRTIANTIVLTRADGSRIDVRGPVSVTCGPASDEGPPALRVVVGRSSSGAPKAYWTAQVGLADLKRKHTFRFPRDDVGGYAVFFAFDDARGQNELSSSTEEARGSITLRTADCRRGVDFRIRAHLGSEFFEQPGANVQGHFRAPAS